MKKSDSKETWSWSRVNYTCLAAWFQHYIQGKEGEDNIWNTGGSFEHEIMEEASKGNLTQKECFEAIKDGWYGAVEGIDIPFVTFTGVPADEHYYNKTLPFFSEINTNWLLGETISTEEHLEAVLPSGELFQGHLDRVTRQDEKLQLRDYKISKRFTRNNIKKKVRQLYAYSYLYKKVHGEYPDELIFEFFQVWDNPYIVPFNEADMWEAIEYIEQRIKLLKGLKIANKIGAKGLFMPDYEGLLKKDGTRDMFCKSVCGFRKVCPFINGDRLKVFPPPKNQEFDLKTYKK